MRQRIPLRLTPFVRDGFVAASETYWLERQESDFLRIIQRKLNDSSYLLVVDAVDDRHHRDNLNARPVQVVDGLQLYVEQVADLAVRIRGVSDAVELQICIAHPGFSGLLCEFKALRKFDSVGRGLHGVVS